VRSYTVTSGAATVSLFSDRFRVRPYGVFEGWPGEANRVLVKRAGRETAETFASAYGRISPSKFADAELLAGDQVIILTGGGGGFGSPLERDPLSVLEDVQEGRVSMEAAWAEYGVVVDSGSVDLPATEERRKTLKQEWNRRPPFASIDGHVVVDDAYIALQGTPELVVPVAVDVASPLVAAARGAIDESICRGECPRRADSRLCPWHSDHGVRFMSPEILSEWTQRHCPQSRNILPKLRP